MRATFCHTRWSGWQNSERPAVWGGDVADILKPIAAGRGFTEAQYREAMDVHRPTLQALYRNYFTENNLSAVVYPTTPIVAEPIDPKQRGHDQGDAAPAFQKYDRNVSPASNAGIPSLSVPAGLTPDGLPAGITFDAPENSDNALLDFGLALDALEPILPPPNLDAPA